MENIMKAGKWDTDFDGIKWAISARAGKSDTRNSIKCVKIDGGLIVTTDGHRLHCYIPDRDIPDGVFSVVRETKDMIILEASDETFPDYERVFPSDGHNGIEPLHVPENNSDGVHPDSIVLNHIIKQADNSFNVDFLLAACPAGEDLRFEQCEGMRPLVIRNEQYTKAAIIMPLRMN